MSGTTRTGARRAIMVRPRNAEGYPRPDEIWIVFYHEEGASILPRVLTVTLKFHCGAQEVWTENSRQLDDGRILTIHLRTRKEPSLGGAVLQTGTNPRDITGFTVEGEGMEPLPFELDPDPQGLEYRLGEEFDAAAPRAASTRN